MSGLNRSAVLLRAGRRKISNVMGYCTTPVMVVVDPSGQFEPEERTVCLCCHSRPAPANDVLCTECALSERLEGRV